VTGDKGEDERRPGTGERSAGLKSNRFWVIILGIIVIVSVIAVLFTTSGYYTLTGQKPASYARIYKEGAGFVTVNLDKINNPYTIIVDYTNDPLRLDGINILEAGNGRIRMLSSDCPDGLCIHQGWRSGGIFPIVCLPNRVIVTFESTGDELDIDAVVW